MRRVFNLASVLVTAVLTNQSNGQVFVRSFGTLNAGERLTTQVGFPTGGEVYVGIGRFDPLNIGLEFDTSGSTADTEIAIYGGTGQILLGCNDDGGVGPGLAFGLQSYIWAGVGAPVNPGTAYYGPTCPSMAWGDGSQAANYRGPVTLIIATFAVSWDEIDAGETPSCGGPGFSAGNGVVRVELF